MSKSYNLGFKESLKSSFLKLELILKVKGGGYEFNGKDFNDEGLEKLRKRILILVRTPQSLKDEISINKFLNLILK